MALISTNTRFFGALIIPLFLSLAFALPTHAATREDNGPDLYLALKAKVVYLEAVLNSLKASQTLDVGPTFVVGLKGSTATISGTLSRPSEKDKVEICSFLQKGTVEWGDGTLTAIAGLGCSGDVTEFETSHTYTTSGSYIVKLFDMQSRLTTSTIAVVAN